MSKKDWETDGLRNGEPIYCPVNAIGDCPYCDRAGVCHIADPLTNCDDFAAFWESWEDYDDADNVDENAPTDFSEDEIKFAEEAFGYDPEIGYNPYIGAYDDDC